MLGFIEATSNDGFFAGTPCAMSDTAAVTITASESAIMLELGFIGTSGGNYVRSALAIRSHLGCNCLRGRVVGISEK